MIQAVEPVTAMTSEDLDALLDDTRARRIYPFDAPWKEAAWFSVKQFLHPFDWSRWTFCPAVGKEAALPAHTNESFRNVLGLGPAKEIDPRTLKPRKIREWPRCFSRAMFDAHLEGQAKYYFRSRDFMPVRVGYQSYDAGFKKLPFDASLLGITGKVKKWDGLKMVMAVIDIDDKLGLGIAQPVCNWLLQNYFPNSYYEPSTNGKGIHFYLKLVMPRHTPIISVRAFMSRFTRHLTGQLSQWMFNNGSIMQLLEEKKCVITSTYRVKSVVEGVPLVASAVIDKIAGLPSCFDELNVLRRGLCIRLPRFPLHMESVIAFNSQPVVLYTLWRRTIGLEDDLVLSSVPFFLSNRASPTGRATKIEADEVGQVEVEEDVYERTHSFVMKACRDARRMLSVDEAMTLYEESGIPKDFSDLERVERRYRISQCLRHISKTFDPEKIKGKRFDLSLKQESQDKAINDIFDRDETLEYRDGERVRKVKRRELTLVYSVFRNNVLNGYKSGLSVQMVQKILVENGCRKALKVAKAVRAKLMEHGFLVQVRPASPGVCGVIYELGSPQKEARRKIRNLWASQRRANEIVGKGQL